MSLDGKRPIAIRVLIWIWRAIFPVWEKRWCVTTSAFGGFPWAPYQCWTKNGEVDSRYAFLLVMPVESEADAIRIAAELNEKESKDVDRRITKGVQS